MVDAEIDGWFAESTVDMLFEIDCDTVGGRRGP